MNVLLDENFPLGLLHILRADGVAAEHIITLGLRGASDATIRERLHADVLFLTQDVDFLAGARLDAIVLVSRVRQSRPLKERMDVWRAAVHRLEQHAHASERLFELADTGSLMPWSEVPPQSTA